MPLLCLVLLSNPEATHQRQDLVVELGDEGLRLDDAVHQGILLLLGQPLDEARNLKRVLHINGFCLLQKLKHPFA